MRQSITIQIKFYFEAIDGKAYEWSILGANMKFLLPIIDAMRERREEANRIYFDSSRATQVE